MPDTRPNRPRGVNFILGGLVVGGAFLVYLVLGGSLDTGGFSVPSVRIGDPVIDAYGGGASAQQALP